MENTLMRKGFTVVELLVAMSVFIILLGIVSNVFISSLRAQRVLVGLMAINDNVSQVLEQMAREIRTGSDFCIPVKDTLCALPLPQDDTGNAIEFAISGGNRVRYALDADGVIVRRVSSGTSVGSFVKLTSSNVRVIHLTFKLVDRTPSFSGRLWPPRIVIALEVGSKQSQLSTVTTHLQTTVSSRDI